MDRGLHVRAVHDGRARLGVAILGRGDDTVESPRRAQVLSVRAFRAYPLFEVRQIVPCRAVRGNSISVNSTIPPLIGVTFHASLAHFAGDLHSLIATACGKALR